MDIIRKLIEIYHKSEKKLEFADLSWKEREKIVNEVERVMMEKINSHSKVKAREMWMQFDYPLLSLS